MHSFWCYITNKELKQASRLEEPHQQTRYAFPLRDRFNAPPHRDLISHIPDLNGQQDSYTQPDYLHATGTTQHLPGSPQQAGHPDQPFYQTDRNVFGIHQMKASNSRMPRSPEGHKAKARRGETENIAEKHNAKKYTEFIDNSDDDPESSSWIHRDKLAMIESKEMQEAGLETPFAEGGQVSSRTRSGRDYIDGTGISKSNQGAQYLYDVDGPSTQPQLHQPYASAEDEEHEAHTPADRNRFAETEGSPQPVYRQNGLRTSSSRIPLATTSPMPIAQEHLDRNTPLLRRRGASGGWNSGDEDGLVHGKIRSRSHSVGSQNLLDNGEQGSGSPPPKEPSYTRGTNSASPSKTRSTSQAKPPTAQHKISTAQNAASIQRPRTASAKVRSSPIQRPATRGASEGRPPTAVNRPEGDPPWLADMFKPDPRLPPDQQLLPTHAKRLQQEKLAREGKFGSPFDQDSQPSSNLQPRSSGAGHSGERIELQTPSNGTWPLRMDSNVPVSPTKSTASGADHAGYSTIPKVQNTPPIGPAPSPRFPQPMQQVQSPAKQQQLQQQPENTQEKKTRGCGCCIVM